MFVFGITHFGERPISANDIRQFVFVLTAIDAKGSEVRFIGTENEMRDFLPFHMPWLDPHVTSGEAMDALILLGGSNEKQMNRLRNSSVPPDMPKDLIFLIRDMRRRSKPIGSTGLGTLLVLRALSDLEEIPPPLVTLGGDLVLARTAGREAGMLLPANPKEVVVDEPNKLFTTPGFLHDYRPYAVREALDQLIEGIFAKISSPPKRKRER